MVSVNMGFMDLHLGQYCCWRSIKLHIVLITSPYLYNVKRCLIIDHVVWYFVISGLISEVMAFPAGGFAAVIMLSLVTCLVIMKILCVIHDWRQKVICEVEQRQSEAEIMLPQPRARLLPRMQSVKVDDSADLPSSQDEENYGEASFVIYAVLNQSRTYLGQPLVFVLLWHAFAGTEKSIQILYHSAIWWQNIFSI